MEKEYPEKNKKEHSTRFPADTDPEPKNVSFRKMRRHKQELSREECAMILAKGLSGVLAVSGDGGYPYAVPISYVYADGKIFFHSALEGHKIDAVKNNPKVSFCVIGADEVIPEKYTTKFKSVIVFGKIRIIDGTDEKAAVARLLGEKYNPGDPAGLEEEIKGGIDRMLIAELTPEHITGKEGIEFTMERNNENA